MYFISTAKPFPVLRSFLSLCIFSIVCFIGTSYAADSNDKSADSKDTQIASMETLLNMDIRDLMKIEVVSATGSLKPLSETPENMEVITAEDIEFMNAHTILEVLNTVTGLAVDFGGGNLGMTGSVTIQGSDATHVTVLVDGVAINSQSSGFPELMTKIPVQIVQRIEIIKGPASSTWGSALGGVINIITKSGMDTKDLNGTLSASYGDSGTGDYRAELYGRKNKLEYYMFAGNFQSDGMQPGFDTYRNGMFSKLAYNFTHDTKVTGSLYYDHGRDGEGYDVFPNPSIYYSDRFENIIGNLSLNTSLSSDVSLNMSAYTMQQIWKAYYSSMPDMATFYYSPIIEEYNGSDAKITWTTGMHRVVAGADYSKGLTKAPGILDGRQGLQKEDVYINDTIVWNKLSVVPGFRFDDTNDFGSFFSPSLGATYKLSDSILLRATAARGFNTPNIGARFGDNAYLVSNPDLKVEQVTSYQAGIETTELATVWLKVSLFQHNVSKALENAPVGPANAPFSEWINSDRVKHQGIEAEVKTLPVFNTALFGGAAYTSTKDFENSQGALGIPKYMFNIGIKYDNDKLFRAVLQGHYIWWNQDASYLAQYNAMIFDISLTKTVYRQKDNACDIFFTAHNIFDGSQYSANYFPDPGRWFEGGVRYKF